mmetsp:Transcript_10440/g.25637  ORF Transcript_10440/g.25637 Transcript_10440/m.25637 type:complete len:460 (-) Transcript_10440:808-2187(-)
MTNTGPIISLRLIPFHPPMRRFSYIHRDFLCCMGVTHFHRLSAHHVKELRVPKPACDLKADRLGIFAKVPKPSVQNNIHVSRLLPGQVGGHHHRKANGGGLRDGARTRLAHQHIRRDHVFRHIFHEPERHHVHISRNVRHIVPLPSGPRSRPVQCELDPPAPMGVERQHLREELGPERLVRLQALRHDRVPTAGIEVGLQLFVAPTDDAYGGIHPLGAELGVQLVHDVREGADALAPAHDEDHSFFVIDAQVLPDFGPVRYPPLGRAIAHDIRLSREIVPYGEAAHDDLFVGDCTPVLGNLLDRFRREVHFIHIFIEPGAVAGSEVCNDREEGNVPTDLLRYFSDGEEGNVVHGWMDRHNNVWIVLLHPLPNQFLVHIIRMIVSKLGIKRIVRYVIQRPPLPRSGAEALVRLPNSTVRPARVDVAPDVHEIVGGSREELSETIGEGLRRGAVSASGVAR